MSENILTEEENNEQRLAYTERRVTHHQGPLPSPENYAQYEQILPGAAERILTMAENQSAHRQDIEKRVIQSDTRNSTIGLFLGFLIVLAFLGIAGFLLYNDKNIAGITLALGTLVSLAGVFVYSSQRKERELEAKK